MFKRVALILDDANKYKEQINAYIDGLPSNKPGLRLFASFCSEESMFSVDPRLENSKLTKKKLSLCRRSAVIVIGIWRSNSKKPASHTISAAHFLALTTMLGERM